ncbi:hypothetical protein [Streptomyces sp. DW26H14]|uniref:hypothetical protein n=1 Tax=Streptomyces sp. DW26H14 TaxID=3435395 RepID=UPI00403D8839
MTDIPETAQAKALAAVAEAGARRGDLLAEADRILTEELRPLAIRAAQLGAGRNRIRELARVGATVLYRWLDEAGVPVRPWNRTEGGNA